jgi:hypothetical protein
VLQCIDAQQEHHRTRTFQEEYRELLRRHGIDFDERHVLGLRVSRGALNRAFSAAPFYFSSPGALPQAEDEMPCLWRQTEAC